MPSRICVAQGAVDLGGRDDLTIVVALGVVSGHVGTGEDKSVTVLTYDHEIFVMAISGADRQAASLRNPCS
jgi:hypothetical protein